MLQDAKKQYSIDGTSENAYKLICELEKSNAEMLDEMINDYKILRSVPNQGYRGRCNRIKYLIEKATGQKIEDLI